MYKKQLQYNKIKTFLLLTPLTQVLSSPKNQFTGKTGNTQESTNMLHIQPGKFQNKITYNTKKQKMG